MSNQWFMANRQAGGAGEGGPLQDAAAWLCPTSLDATRVAELLYRAAHPAGPRCPGCGSEPPASVHPRFYAGAQIRCRECDRRYSARSGTVLQGCRLSETQLVLLLALLGLGVEPRLAARAAGTSDETARQWRRRLWGLA